MDSESDLPRNDDYIESENKAGRENEAFQHCASRSVYTHLIETGMVLVRTPSMSKMTASTLRALILQSRPRRNVRLEQGADRSFNWTCRCMLQDCIALVWTKNSCHACYGLQSRFHGGIRNRAAIRRGIDDVPQVASTPNDHPAMFIVVWPL